MKMRAGLLVTCAASAMAIGLGFASPALAADVMPTKAPVVVAPTWWYEGYAEVGGRFFMNHPDNSTLGKFYEYRDLHPGVFGNFRFGAHKTGADPLDFSAWGKNIGWDDQSFGLEFAKPGQYYLNFEWDETPHTYWQNAQTLYNGVGTNNLTIRPGGFLTPTPDAADQAKILANSQTVDVGFRRDTASAKARWTPTDNWDFNLDYTHTHRDGTQPLSAVSFSGPTATRSTFELIRPIDDTTQNADLKGQYAGATPWGTPFNVALSGGISAYDNADTSLIFQNPWNQTNAANQPLNNLYSLPQNNRAETIAVSGGIGLPANSRYMGTFEYMHLSSDDPSLPWSINPLVPAVTYTTPNRDARTMLFNNVLYTQITSNVKTTLKYRYYDYNTLDDSPVIVFPTWYSNPDTNTGATTDAEMRYPRNFTKQNADAQIDYRPWKWLNVGALYDWERWDRDFRNVAVTNENTGKIFADSTWGFSTLRASLQYGQRRYDDYINFDGANNDAFRMKDLANRDRTKGLVTWTVDVTDMLSVTPNGGFRYDDYQTDIEFFTPGEIGLKKDNSWNAGIDATLHVSPALAFFVSYMYERGYREVFENASPPKADVATTDTDHTFIVGSKLTVIPQKLFINTNFSYTRAISQWDLGCTPAGCQYDPLAVYPDVHNNLTRLDMTAKYMLDDSVLRNAGFVGKAFVKLRVLWERNTNDAWQPLQDQFGWLVNPTNATTAYSIWLGTGQTNYDVVMGQVSFGVKW
jgi:MtrB/PioB family decaheme-associated outer membrane protein